nr:multidrug resistance-associated protein 5 [Tanacetum cinerariifolium]
MLVTARMGRNTDIKGHGLGEILLLTRCIRNADGKPECTYRMWASWMQKERSFQVNSLVDEQCCSRTYEFVGRDGNNQVYPIARAFVDVENKENWTWFMQCLIDDLGIAYGEGLTIISDQHKALLKQQRKLCLWLNISNVLDTLMPTLEKDSL